MEWEVPLADVRFEPDEIEAVADVYRSGWLSQGPRVAEFEAAFAQSVGSPHAIAVANGTAALHLICAGLGLGPGDEVIVPSLTFAASAAAIVQAGATPVFADVRGPGSPWLSTDAVSALIGDRTRAVVAVSYGGHPGELLALRELAGARGLLLVEDAAHALGSRAAPAREAGARHIGTIGDAGAFSFFANKNMPLGEGGMIVTADARLAERARLLRSHGMTSGTWDRHNRGSASYDVVEPGFNYRLDEARSALGTLLLGRLAANNERRATIAARYSRELSELDGVEPAIAPDRTRDGVNAWHIYPVLLDDAIDRSAFRAHLHAAGVQTSIHYPPLHQTQAFADRPRGRLPATEAYARRTVTIPLFPHMTEAQIELVVDAIATAAAERSPTPYDHLR